MNSPFARRLFALWTLSLAVFALASMAQAQSFRFTLRAEPEVLPANGISTSTIFVQVPQRGAISAAPIVRFATTAGVIESQTQLAGGVARVLLRSAATPGTAVVTAFIGSSREAITVEFTDSDAPPERFLEVAAPYVAYGSSASVISASGGAVLDFGGTHIQSDTRLDVDLYSERVWAQGNVLIRQGEGQKAKELRGDRLFYDLRKRRGVMRRAGGTDAEARQEFVGADFAPPAADEADPTPPEAPAPPQKVAKDPTAGKNGDLPLLEPTVPLAAPEEAETAPQEGQAPQKLWGAPDLPATPGLNLQPAKTGQNTPLPTHETRASALVTMPRPNADNTTEGESPVAAPPYAPLPAAHGPTPRIVELPPPDFDVQTGYWVTARRLRVFPRDKVQFERAGVFFNGKRVFKMPLYVLPLDGTFNPTTDLVSFNSQGGARVKFPISYMASPSGTGQIYLRHEPGDGFSTQRSGFSLGLDQQYWLSDHQNGRLWIDQLGKGAWDLNLRHEFQFDPRTQGNFYLTMPRHRDFYARTALNHDFSRMQIGLESFYNKPEAGRDDLRAQFYARLRPRELGQTGWNYTLGANLLAVRRVYHTSTQTLTLSPGRGGGIGLPGSGPQTITTSITTARPLFGQTLNATLQSPTYKPWRGAALDSSVFTTAFNYSDNRRGLSPGLNMGLTQGLGRDASLRLDYTYDRASLGLYGATGDSFTHYVSGTLGANLTSKIGLTLFGSKSLGDGSLYSTADLDFALTQQWRMGLFSDYSDFDDGDGTLNYGLTLGRKIGVREVTLNYDALRGRVYFELGATR